jgi:carbon starvation protein
MFTENTLALLSLVAVSIAGTGGGAGRFAAGVGSLLTVLFGDGFKLLGTALGFGAFMVIVLTVTQLIFRVMRVTLSEWVGETLPVLKNMHISTIVSMVLTILLVLTGTWVYLWQMFGAANQLMAGRRKRIQLSPCGQCSSCTSRHWRPRWSPPAICM